MDEMNQPKVPNSLHQGMAKVLEEALFYALMPIVERLDRIEDWVSAQPPINQEQLTHALEPISQQLADQDQDLQQVATALEEVADATTRLADRLQQWEQERNTQLTQLTELLNVLAANQVQAQLLAPLEEKLDNITQDYNDLVEILTPMSSAWNQVVEIMQQLQGQEQSRQNRYLEQDNQIDNLTQSYNSLVTALTPTSKALNQLLETLPQWERERRQLLVQQVSQISYLKEKIGNLPQEWSQLITALMPLSKNWKQLVERVNYTEQQHNQQLQQLNNRNESQLSALNNLTQGYDSLMLTLTSNSGIWNHLVALMQQQMEECRQIPVQQSSNFNSLEKRIENLTQEWNNLTTILTPWSKACQQIVERMNQADQQHSQQSETLIYQLDNLVVSQD